MVKNLMEIYLVKEISLFGNKLNIFIIKNKKLKLIIFQNGD